MKTKDFERAIEALGIQDLEVQKFSYTVNGGVTAVYGRMGERTYLKWDFSGRGFTYEMDSGQCVDEVRRPEYLDYRRDADFDLKFD